MPAERTTALNLFSTMTRHWHQGASSHKIEVGVIVFSRHVPVYSCGTSTGPRLHLAAAAIPIRVRCDWRWRVPEA